MFVFGQGAQAAFTFRTSKDTSRTSFGGPQTQHDGLARVSFLDLAAELRNEVYALVLLEGEAIVGRYCGIPRRHKTKLALVGASRQISKEATPVFFGGNTFELEGALSIERMLHCLRPPSLDSLRVVRFVDTINVAPPLDALGRISIIESFRSQIHRLMDVRKQHHLRPEIFHIFLPKRREDHCLVYGFAFEKLMEIGVVKIEKEAGRWRIGFVSPEIIQNLPRANGD
ncbi:Hypothetical predicted protein [Lecanosticta acicola]|uniref:Uncharacterized protein n=1 Tax=Lecanosticta acicola TaxID=111012 RepID=A0AAI8Z7B2_9PEZI|nr:Hypothetical predicted protein [Lecanosticta acicola]